MASDTSKYEAYGALFIPASRAQFITISIAYRSFNPQHHPLSRSTTPQRLTHGIHLDVPVIDTEHNYASAAYGDGHQHHGDL
ncbi:hypothetical protein VTO73DRAFT_7063 [Trametes versicolor]